MLTRGGVAYNLQITPFVYTIEYDDAEILSFKFSSNYNMHRFKEKIQENRKKINTSLSNRFGFSITNNKICDIKLYSMIEKRGFLIENKGVSYKCLNNIKLNGKNKISKT